MPETRKKRGLPNTEKQLREETEKYFERCRQDDVPPTPSGLALWMGVRTSQLYGDRLTEGQRTIIDQAMQRIEANTMEMMLTRGGVKGMESVLERVEENEGEGRVRAEIRNLTDEELKSRLNRLLPQIRKAVEK